ncbi:MAG: FkbM family methyltransferase [Burkholderiaceae bacterium]|nr:FkbM family methyltransferase [Burkholderiaceae bacterium]
MPHWRSVAMWALDAAGVGDLLRLSRGALAQYGWRRSVRERAAVDAQGSPLPWLCYPAIDLLAARVRPELRVFEYGCGHSTLWWAERVRVLAAVEHDAAWHARMQARLPAHVALRHVPLVDGGDYCRAAVQAAGAATRWDIVVVDGRDRVNCMQQAVGVLSDGGVMVVDNTDRPQYAPGLDWLRERGFRRLPLRGLAPIVDTLTETSLLYRPGNVLDL